MSTRTPPRAADYLKGESPAARGKAKKRKVLVWILRWGYSSADIIRQVSGRDRNGYAVKLAREGLVKEFKVGNRTGKFYVLTRDGLAEAVQESEDDLCYPEIDHARVHLGQMTHYLRAQKVTINALRKGKITDYKTERMFAEGVKGEKRSDVIWVTNDGRDVGVEIEQSAKKNRELDQFVYRVITSMDDQSGKGSKLSRTAIVAKTESMQTRYRKAMQPGATLKLWERNPSRNVWESKRTMRVPDWLINRVYFTLMD